VADLADYLGLTVGQAREQFRALLARRAVSSGRQVTFLPAETLLCLAASFVVNQVAARGAAIARVPAIAPPDPVTVVKPTAAVTATIIVTKCPPPSIWNASHVMRGYRHWADLL
jgi:putative restriction endonuclease